MSPRALPPGTPLGRYQVVSLLGQGPCGLTYLASDPDSGAKVAIKEYLPAAYALRNPDHSVSPISDLEQDDYEFGRERFRADAQGLQRVRHPSLVAVLDVFEANGTVYMVMACEDGPSLAEALSCKPSLTEREILNIAVSLIDAFRTLHGAGLIHRDVKEAHIRLRPDGTPVLLDFGAARVGLLRRRLAIGTGNPELDSSKLDGSAGPWTDIHALAAMLFRVAKRLGESCSPQIVDAMRVGISVQPDDVAPLTAQWSQQIVALLRNLPAPEQPEAPAQAEENKAGAAATAAEEDGGAFAVTVGADADRVGAQARHGGAAPARPEDEVALELAAKSFPATSSAEAEPAEESPSGPEAVISVVCSDAEAAIETAEISTLSAPPIAGGALMMERAQQPECSAPCDTRAPEHIESAAAVVAAARRDFPGPASVRPLDPQQGTLATSTVPAASAEPEAAPDLDRLTRWVAAAAVVAIVFGVVMWTLDARSPLPSMADVQPSLPAAPAAGGPVPAGEVGHHAVVASAPVTAAVEQPGDPGIQLPEAPGPAPSTVTSPSPDAARKAEIDGLLAEAAKDVAELRLTTPRGSNAVEKYEAVLALDPGNDAARQGLSAVSDRYVDLASTALTRGQLAAARRYLELAQSIAPDNARVQTLRRELEARQQQAPHRSAEETVAAEWHGGLYDRVQEFLESNQARPPRPPSRAEQIPDRLGGQR